MDGQDEFQDEGFDDQAGDGQRYIALRCSWFGNLRQRQRNAMTHSADALCACSIDCVVCHLPTLNIVFLYIRELLKEAGVESLRIDTNLPETEDLGIFGVSADSRTAQPDDLFVALKARNQPLPAAVEREPSILSSVYTASRSFAYRGFLNC